MRPTARARHLVAAIALVGSLAQGQVVEQTIALDELGDAAVTFRMTVGPDDVAALVAHPDAAIRLAGLDRTWHALDDPTATHLGGGVLEVRHRIRGLARPGSDGWSVVPLGHDLGPSRIETSPGRLRLVEETGAGRRLLEIRGPAGDEAFRFREETPAVLVRLAPTGPIGTPAEATFALEACPRLLACLAPSVGQDRFGLLWVARAALTAGGKPLERYRIRFRIAGYSAGWSPWSTCPLVRPGQTIADAYYPVLDIEAMGRVAGRRQAALEVEYEFDEVGGRTIRESETRPIDVLGRNEVQFSSRPDREWVLWKDGADLMPWVLPSMVSRDDPIVQRVAGLIHGSSVGGTAASTSKAEALEYLRSVFRFVRHNRIAYQTPPAFLDRSAPGARSTQHIKYPRDVLRNRAGTCIDLAILYASLCEAAGLDAVLILVPGHCFPAIRNPEDRAELIPIESTSVHPLATFEEACQYARETHFAPFAAGAKPGLLIDVQAMRSRGVQPLELPPLPPGALDAWGGYEAPPPDLTGVWVARATEYTLTHVFEAGGRCGWVTTDRFGNVVARWEGRYAYRDGSYHFTGTGPFAGTSSRCTLTFDDDDRFTSRIEECTDRTAIGVSHVHVRQRE